MCPCAARVPLVLVLLLEVSVGAAAEPVVAAATEAAPATTTAVPVNKCCEELHVMLDGACTDVSHTNTTPWRPLFTDLHGRHNVHVPFTIVIGNIRHTYIHVPVFPLIAH